jgi:hypothetical protein
MAGAVIVLEFNELSPDLMSRFIAEGRLPGFSALREQSATYVTDAQEAPPNLEPWIQWVTVHTGLPFSQHRVFDLGDAHKLDAPRLWDLVLDAGKKVWICGSMNAAVRSSNADGRAYFIPDPWCTGAPAVPAGMFDTFYTLTSRYVQEHTRDRAPWSKQDYAAFLWYVLTHGLSLRTISDIVLQLSREVKSKGSRWRRAILLDRFQWDLFRHTWKKVQPDFATFFLNSTAHFQHYHWREFEPSLFSSGTAHMSDEAKEAIPIGYQSMDRIVQECLRMAPNATIVLMTALSQQPLLRYEGVGGKFIFKPVDHAALLHFAGFDGNYRYAPVMAEEFKLHFDSEAAAEQAERALLSLKLDGSPAMSARRDGTEIFCGCAVYSLPPAGTLVQAGNHAETFDKLFYQVDGVKSGGHHPDGIFWIRKPNGKRVDSSRRISLLQASALLADLVNVRFKDASPAPVELRATS